MAAQPQKVVGGCNIGKILVLPRDSKKVQIKGKITAGIRIKGFLPKENGSGRAGTREDRLCPSQKEQRVNVQAKHEERLLAL